MPSQELEEITWLIRSGTGLQSTPVVLLENWTCCSLSRDRLEEADKTDLKLPEAKAVHQATSVPILCSDVSCLEQVQCLILRIHSNPPASVSWVHNCARLPLEVFSNPPYDFFLWSISYLGKTMLLNFHTFVSPKFPSAVDREFLPCDWRQYFDPNSFNLLRLVSWPNRWSLWGMLCGHLTGMFTSSLEGGHRPMSMLTPHFFVEFCRCSSHIKTAWLLDCLFSPLIVRFCLFSGGNLVIKFAQVYSSYISFKDCHFYYYKMVFF